jgi:NADPH-dependent curcumin reductase CurA
MVSNKQVIFTSIPTAFPVAGKNMKIKESTIDLDAELPKGDFILKTLEISVDPYMRGRMRDPSIDSYAPAFPINEPMTGDTMSVVVKSNNPDYKVDDLVYGRTGQGIFEEYVQVNAQYAKNAYVVRNDAKTNGLPLSHYVGVLAMPGMTAYYGLNEIGKPKKGETLYVSAAAGAVGQLVGQFGKTLGLYVVGSAGSDEKVEHLKSIGFDAAFNYKNGDIEENLRKHCPNGIDVYFEGVGGKMLDAVLAVANNFARIIACGMISQYNLEKPEPLYNSMYIVSKRIKLDGFIIMDHMDFEETFLKDVTPLLVNGQVKYKEDIVNGIENTPQALVDVLHGKNFGKMVVHVADL